MLKIHLPVDSILLKNLAEVPGLETLATEKWTILDANRYWWLAEKIAVHMGFFNWIQAVGHTIFYEDSHANCAD